MAITYLRLLQHDLRHPHVVREALRVQAGGGWQGEGRGSGTPIRALLTDSCCSGSCYCCGCRRDIPLGVRRTSPGQYPVHTVVPLEQRGVDVVGFGGAEVGRTRRGGIGCRRVGLVIFRCMGRAGLCGCSVLFLRARC